MIFGLISMLFGHFMVATSWWQQHIRGIKVSDKVIWKSKCKGTHEITHTVKCKKGIVHMISTYSDFSRCPFFRSPTEIKINEGYETSIFQKKVLSTSSCSSSFLIQACYDHIIWIHLLHTPINISILPNFRSHIFCKSTKKALIGGKSIFLWTPIIIKKDNIYYLPGITEIFRCRALFRRACFVHRVECTL